MKITHRLKLDKTYAGKEIVWEVGAVGFGEVVLGDFRLVTSGQAASASILEMFTAPIMLQSIFLHPT